MNKPKTNTAANPDKVSAMDVCQTPAYAVEMLLPYLEQFKGQLIWESACGPDRLIMKALSHHGHFCVGTDLLEGLNFMEYEPTAYYWAVQVTNPPYSIKYQWLKRSFELGKPFALLVPYETTFAGKFQKLVEQYQYTPYVIEVLSPSQRINYKMPNKGWDSAAQMPTCWVCWGLKLWTYPIASSSSFHTYYQKINNKGVKEYE